MKAQLISILLVIITIISITACSNNSDKDDLENETAYIPTPLPSLIEMISLSGGTFQMGSIDEDGQGDEQPIHTITISPFDIAKYEVTYEKLNEVKTWAENNSYTFNTLSELAVGEETHPVKDIEWYDAVLWCNALSEMEGRIPCYYDSIDKKNVYRSGRIDIKNDWVKWDANGYRLPTEAEWEYACRAGSTTTYSFGDTLEGNDANFKDSGDPYDNGTTPVGSYNPNNWGIYDIHGNVLEWCWDWYLGDYYASSTTLDPRGPSEGTYRVHRGGSYSSIAVASRSANRGYDSMSNPCLHIGLRPVRS